MANIDHAPSRTMLNLLHVLPAFADADELRLNVIVELNSMTINKETMKLDRKSIKIYKQSMNIDVKPMKLIHVPWNEH